MLNKFIKSLPIIKQILNLMKNLVDVVVKLNTIVSQNNVVTQTQIRKLSDDVNYLEKQVSNKTAYKRIRSLRMYCKRKKDHI